MKKIAYIGHGFHQKTKSTQFFIDILFKYYNVDFYWTMVMSYKSDFKKFKLDKKEYDALIFFQVLPSVEEIETCLCKNIVLIPMFDNDLAMKTFDWNIYYKYKFINFSKTLYEKMKFLKFPQNLYLQYAPKPIDNYYNRNLTNKKPKLFFWQRSNHINWNLIKKIIDFNQIDSIHLHRIETDFGKDQWFEMPLDNDIKNYKITLSSWFKSKEELIKVMNECDIFIAPRLFEGIGQTFLEAMSLGKCVISPDFPTMNEYIIHNKNGILFDYLYPEKINLSNWKEIGQNAKNSIEKINQNWEDKKYSIIDFINNKSSDFIPISYNEYLQKINNLTKDTQYNFIVEDIKLDFINKKLDSKSINFSKYLNILIDFISKNINQSEQYIIYGTGTGAKLLSSLIPSDSIIYFVDVDIEKQKKLFANKPVLHPKELVNSDKKIIISLFGRYYKIADYLEREYDIKKSRLINLDF